jgi:hypothetical protein
LFEQRLYEFTQSLAKEFGELDRTMDAEMTGEYTTVRTEFIFGVLEEDRTSEHSDATPEPKRGA